MRKKRTRTISPKNSVALSFPQTIMKIKETLNPINVERQTQQKGLASPPLPRASRRAGREFKDVNRVGWVLGFLRTFFVPIAVKSKSHKTKREEKQGGEKEGKLKHFSSPENELLIKSIS